MSFIKLKIHPKHPKVLRMAALTRCSRQAVFCAAVQWFRWVDENCAGDPSTGIDAAAVDDICDEVRKPRIPMSQAMQDPDVNWITIEGGIVQVVDIEANFANTAKRRAQDSERKRRQRERDRAAKQAAESQGESRHLSRVTGGGQAGVDFSQRRGEESKKTRTAPVQSQRPARHVPRPTPAQGQAGSENGQGVSLGGGDWTGAAATPQALPEIGPCPAPDLEPAWRGDVDRASEENAAAVLHALSTLRIFAPASERIVLARRLTVPMIAAKRAEVLADPHVQTPLPCLVGKLLRASGLPRKADKLEELTPAERGWISTIERLREQARNHPAEADRSRA